MPDSPPTVAKDDRKAPTTVPIRHGTFMLWELQKGATVQGPRFGGVRKSAPKVGGGAQNAPRPFSVQSFSTSEGFVVSVERLEDDEGDVDG